jgi:hypothetical protein
MRGTEIGVQIFQVLSPVLMAVVTWMAAKLAQLINARVKNEYLRGVLVRLDDAVMSVVREVNQVTVEAIKSASTDGRLTTSAREVIKNAALAAVKAHLGAKGLVELSRVLGLDTAAVDRMIGTRIEATVHDLKAKARVMNGVNTNKEAPDAGLPLPG